MQEQTSTPETLTGKALLQRLAELANDKKGHDIVALDVRKLVYYTDYFLIVTGRTDLHVRGMVKYIEGELLAQEVRPISVEGQEHNRWVLMDYGDVIVHLFFEPLRDLYELERLWADAVRIELNLATPSMTQTAKDGEDDDDLFDDFD